MNTDIYQDDKPKSFCGIFGVYGTPYASIDTYYGLHALQHRGQEASGIITKHNTGHDKVIFNIQKGDGLVSEVFPDQSTLTSQLCGDAAIGHNRYSTTGSSLHGKNIQPLYVNYRNGNLAVAHNGNLTNETQIRTQLVHEGSIFQTTTDTEVILHLIAKSRLDDQIDQIKEALSKIEGAYCLLLLTDDKLIAARDPQGFRPLCLGKKDGSFVIASETCAFDMISAQYIRDIEPGEIVVIDDEVIRTGNIKTHRLIQPVAEKKHCIFEFVYFSRPDSKIFGHSVDKVRRRLGKILADYHPVEDPDGEKVIVISVPDSSNTAALGYATRLQDNGINAKLEIGLIRSHYIGRTFIQPGQTKREMDVRIKFNVVRGVIEGKTVVVIDDSIVRGTTSKLLINLIRSANPKQIHMRISSPPITSPCYYGMDFPSKDELIANKMHGSIEEIRQYLGVESLEYLTTEELLKSIYEADPDHFCTACFTGKYPVMVNSQFNKEMHES
ncbi:MAG: amidophosphoribosyltransferase [Ignavibacteriaceae bacterium]|nr:amidophosphoribosyltransferase [Ignavibacteriaceae bacterium]